MLNLLKFKNKKIDFYICADVVDDVASTYRATHGNICVQHMAHVRVSLAHVISG